MPESGYARTDLACESPSRGVEEYEKDGVRVSVLTVTRENEAETGRAPGTYVTVDSSDLSLLDDGKVEALTAVLSSELRRMTERVTGQKIGKKTKVLVCGLGNRFITPDALGPQTADKVTVTRHVVGTGGVFDALDCSSVSAIQPGVLGQTGIEASDMIRGTAEKTHPDVIVAVDALAARSCARLTKTFQLSDAGIAPGSGIGNRRTAISEKVLGIPVIALGVPTVVDSSTLVYDALAEAGISEIGDALRNVLENGKKFYVSPKDSDVLIRELSGILAAAIDRTFGADFS